MKKFLAILLSTAMVIGLTSCGVATKTERKKFLSVYFYV